MVSDAISATNLRLYGYLLSTVSCPTVTGDVTYNLSDIDLAMKLHYLRAVYYFKGGGPAESLTTNELKAPTFPWLDHYYPVNGRIRRAEDGRPFIKCNDAGVRIVEAKCGYEMEEWLKMKEHDRHSLLVSDKVLGPQLQFSPNVYIQFTKFKCGGLAVGFSWAHLFGDPITATNFINLWGHLLAGKNLPPKVCHESPLKPSSTPSSPPLSIKHVEPIGDHWKAPTAPTMSSFSLKIPQTKLKDLKTKASTNITDFEAISALIWKYIALIREENCPKSITVVRTSNDAINRYILGNSVVIATVTTECTPTEMELSELAMFLKKQAVNETEAIGEGGDVVVYGARLTFVDMEEVELDGLEIMGQKAVEIEYRIDGVGDEGTVLVRRGVGGERVVTLMLVEEEMRKVREMMESELGVV